MKIPCLFALWLTAAPATAQLVSTEADLRKLKGAWECQSFRKDGPEDQVPSIVFRRFDSQGRASLAGSYPEGHPSGIEARYHAVARYVTADGKAWVSFDAFDLFDVRINGIPATDEQVVKLSQDLLALDPYPVTIVRHSAEAHVEHSPWSDMSCTRIGAMS